MRGCAGRSPGSASEFSGGLERELLQILGAAVQLLGKPSCRPGLGRPDHAFVSAAFAPRAYAAVGRGRANGADELSDAHADLHHAVLRVWRRLVRLRGTSRADRNRIRHLGVSTAGVAFMAAFLPFWAGGMVVARADLREAAPVAAACRAHARLCTMTLPSSRHHPGGLMPESVVESQLRKLGLTLPPPPAAVGAYVTAVRAGNLAVTSGQLPWKGDRLLYTGKLGSPLTVEQGYEAARLCALNALAQLKVLLGDLDKVRQIMRLEGYVHCGPGFRQHPRVLDGASELMNAVFGEKG